MSKAREVKFDIKVVINKEKTKVLFAEAGSDFTDVLLSILLLPLGTIMKVLKQHYGVEAPVIGSLNTLYKMWPFPNLFGDYESIWGRLKFNYFDLTSSNSGKEYDGVFTTSGDSFIISDDLQIMPAGSIINTLSNLSIAITDMDGAETRNVTFGFDELMTLLKESLISRNPLSAILLPGSQMNLATILKYEHRNTQIDEKAISMNPMKVVLKVMIQKSTFKLLFAQADQDFIDFLLALLRLPLGRVEWYYGSNTGLKNIDNLHRSIATDNFDEYLSDASTNCNLINPTVYGNKNASNEFFPLSFHPNKNYDSVKGSRMYVVSDDLTVAPMTITSGISVINEMKISFSDVTELEVQVGLEEGLSILKAALTSTTALTDGLIKPMLKKPKQES